MQIVWYEKLSFGIKYDIDCNKLLEWKSFSNSTPEVPDNYKSRYYDLVPLFIIYVFYDKLELNSKLLTCKEKI